MMSGTANAKKILRRIFIGAVAAAAICSMLLIAACKDPNNPHTNENSVIRVNPGNADDPNRDSGFTPPAPGQSFKVTVNLSMNGAVKIDRADGIYMYNDVVPLTIEADDGYECSFLNVVISNIENVSVSGSLSDLNRTFRMPGANVFVYVAFRVKRPLNAIRLGEQVACEIKSVSHAEALFTTMVTLTVQPGDPRYVLEARGLRAVGDTTGKVVYARATNRKNEYSFEMPNEPVTLHAFFFDPTIEQFAIRMNLPADNSGNSVIVKGVAAAGETVTVAMYLRDDYELAGAPGVQFKGTALPVTQNSNPIKWTFTMPGEGAIVTGDIITVSANWTILHQYAIAGKISDDSHGSGNFTITGLNGAGKVSANSEVTLSLKVNDPENFFYRSGSIRVAGESSQNADLSNRLTQLEDRVWRLALPPNAPAETVEIITVSAFIEGVPAHLVTLAGVVDNGKTAGTVTITPRAAGKDIGANELKVRQGKPVTASLAYDPDDYEFTPGSFKATYTASGQALAAPEGAVNTMTFVMPPEPITISAGLIAKPFIAISTSATPNGTGAIRLAISNETGPKANAREGYTVTVSAVPAAGYAASTAGPTVTPSTPLQQGARNTWTFTMPAHPVHISWDFVERGHLEIFKGGPKLEGLAIGQGAWPYGNNHLFADWNNTDGRIPGTAAIRIGPNSKTGSMNYATAGELGFHLEVPGTVDASWAGAVSFYMKRESGNAALGNAWMGFGEGSNMAVWFGDSNNQQIPITNEWKRYIVPVPNPKEGMNLKRIFFWKANANAVWLIDDIEFIPKAQVTLDSITIPARYPTRIGISVGAVLDVFNAVNYDTGSNAMSFSYSVSTGDAVSATMFSKSGAAPEYEWSSWIPKSAYTFSAYGGASISGANVTPTVSGGNFELTVTFNQVESNRMSFMIEDVNVKVLEDFEVMNISTNGGNGYWDRMFWREFGGGANARDNRSMVYKYVQDAQALAESLPNDDYRQGFLRNQDPQPRAGRNLREAVDLSAYQTLSFYIRGDPASIEADTLSFGLSNGANFARGNGSEQYITNNLGTLIYRDFTVSTGSGLRKISISLANFAAAGLDLTTVTGWAFMVKTVNGAAGGTAENLFYLDDITAEK